MAKFSTGDRVRWITTDGETEGTIVETRTEDAVFEGQKFAASDEDPIFIVESEETGARAAHHAGALKKG
ncbi:MAG TPA: DUF2945 domain-containing protein [Microbacterium sp.]|nr:DUF2945 domain-containing protein [Microbacterium sp.]